MQYLAQAALNKAETLLDFSLIKSDVPIQDPQQLTFMEAALAGIDHNLKMPVDERQQCQRQDHEVVCRIQSQLADRRETDHFRFHVDTEQYLQHSYIIPCHDQRIRQTAREIVTKADGTHQQILFLIDWMRANIRQEPEDVFSALDVLDGKKAECQGHTFLYTALARALGIPTRVVNGIVYSVEFQGFLYHTWAESLVDSHWIAIDPTFRQVPADATHIKLIEGEKVSDLLPLVDLIGKLKLRIIQMH
jgi:hypothetical protein